MKQNLSKQISKIAKKQGKKIDYKDKVDNKTMQQNNHTLVKSLQSQSPSQYLTQFVGFLQTKEKLIETEFTHLLTHPSLGLAHAKYPVKSLKFRKPKFPKEEECGSWYDIKTKMQNRLTKLKDEQPNSLIVTSDLLIWSIPNLCSSYMGMMNYIKKWKAEELTKQTKEQQSEKNELCKKLIANKDAEEFKLKSTSEEVLELQLLKVPLVLISDYFQKWLQITKYYEQKQADFKERLMKIFEKPETQQSQSQSNPQADLLKNLLNLAKLEKIQIQNRVKQAEKYIQDIESVESLDPEVYKNRLILSQYKPQVNPKNKYLQQFGKRLHFLMRLKKRVLKAEKNLKQRKGAVFQLIDMERNYIEILTGYIEGIKQPIEKLKVLSEAEERLLFCNIEEIKKFHQELYQILVKRYQKHEKYTTYGDIIKGVIPFFKLYIDYIYQAQNAHNFIVKLIKENEKIREICDKYFIEKHKPASDELLQPTYKIARYEMLFEEIIKKSNPSTADYKLFTEAKQLFNSKLTEVNDTVDRIVRRNKLNQLELEFGTQEQPIFTLREQSQVKDHQKRPEPVEYLNEFSVQIIYQEKYLNAILFAFTHLILIVQQSTRKKLYYIKVDEKFYVRREDDSKVYRNVIKIHSKEGYVTVSTGNDEKNLKKVEELYEVLKKIQKTTQSKELIYVQVLGTEEIGSTSFAKYTEYIIEVKFLALKKLLHLRFSQIANIVKVMQHEYKNSLGITEEQNLKKTWFNNHKSKTIEDRKRIIQQILQKLFNHELIKKQPKKLLQYLNLPQNFFQIAKNLAFENIMWSNQSKFKKRETKDISPISSSKMITSQQNSSHNSNLAFEKEKSMTMSKLTDSSAFQGLKIPDLVMSSLVRSDTYLSKKQLKEAFTLLCATEIKLGRDIYHDVDQKVQIEKGEVEKVQIFINIMPQNEEKMVRVTKYDTVEDVCNKVSKLLGLRENRDFRLFHEIGKKELRVLEHEQLILNIFSFPRSKRQSSSSSMPSVVENVTSTLQSMASSIIKVLSPQTLPTLIFKKYYFLPFEIESRQCRKDLTRLRLVTYQVFAEVKDMKYQLNFDEYLDMTALLIYIELDGNVDLQKIEPSIIHRIIPETIFKLKNYSEQEWLKKVEPKLLKYTEQLTKVIQYNEHQINQNKIKTDSPQKTALYFGHRHLASQIVLNKIKSNHIYGSNLFYVQPYKKTYEQLKNQSLKMSYNMWLAVKVDSISLLTPSSKQSQFQLKYTEIEKINVYSEAIVFKTDDYTNKEYRFNTYQSFEISQLVRYYKTLNEIMRELKQDEKLSNEVKKYRNQIQKYRSTYENHQENYNHLQINFASH